MYICVRMCLHTFCNGFFFILCTLGTTWANNIVWHFPQKGGNAAMPASGMNTVIILWLSACAGKGKMK